MGIRKDFEAFKSEVRDLLHLPREFGQLNARLDTIDSRLLMIEGKMRPPAPAKDPGETGPHSTVPTGRDMRVSSTDPGAHARAHEGKAEIGSHPG